MSDPNLSQLIAAGDALRPLLGELVFIGGCVTGLLITDEAAGDPAELSMWMRSRRLHPTRSTPILGSGYALSASQRILPRARHFVAGSVLG